MDDSLSPRNAQKSFGPFTFENDESMTRVSAVRSSSLAIAGFAESFVTLTDFGLRAGAIFSLCIVLACRKRGWGRREGAYRVVFVSSLRGATVALIQPIEANRTTE